MLPDLLDAAGKASPKHRFVWSVQPPEMAGMSEAGLEGIRGAIRRNVEKGTITGAVTAVARRGKLVMFEAQGLADVSTKRPMTTDSLFRIMSSTKPITAVAVMMMLEEGRLALEDPVSKFIPSFHAQRVVVSPARNADPAKVQFVPAVRDVTIKDLLTHTSGLATFSEGVPALEKLSKEVEHKPGDTLASYVPKLGKLPLDFQPGTKWSYSPLAGMETLLYLVELVSRVPADRFLRERIFDPLNMRDTWFNVPTREKKRLVNIYKAEGGTFEKRPWLFGDGPSTYFSGAGGLTSCAHDLLNFELMLLGKGSYNGRQLLKPETVELMTRNQVGSLFAEWIPPITGGSGFGLGVSVLQDEARGHGKGAGAFGWGGAYGTESWADPKLDLAAVMLIQMDPAPASPRMDFTRALRSATVA